jgi:hypothetical protein
MPPDRAFSPAVYPGQTPQVDQRPDGNIHRAVGFGANAQRSVTISAIASLTGQARCWAKVKAHQRRVVFPGGAAIVGIQLRLNFAAQRFGASSTPSR